MNKTVNIIPQQFTKVMKQSWFSYKQ